MPKGPFVNFDMMILELHTMIRSEKLSLQPATLRGSRIHQKLSPKPPKFSIKIGKKIYFAPVITICYTNKNNPINSDQQKESTTFLLLWAKSVHKHRQTYVGRNSDSS